MFKLPYEFMEQKRVQTLFGNQGLYNGFLAVGLLWAQFAAPDNAVYGATVLFLGFVLIAAAWGAFSSGNKGILVKQGLPAFWRRRCWRYEKSASPPKIPSTASSKSLKACKVVLKHGYACRFRPLGQMQSGVRLV